MINNAIRRAPNEHVVYFLLTSYLDARRCDPRGAGLPEYAKQLPLSGSGDLHERLRALSEACDGRPGRRARIPPVLEEAVGVLRAASERIASLQDAGHAPASWNVVERSQGGHVRRRRLAYRLTDREAAEWSARTGMQLERADESFNRDA